MHEHGIKQFKYKPIGNFEERLSPVFILDQVLFVLPVGNSNFFFLQLQFSMYDSSRMT